MNLNPSEVSIDSLESQEQSQNAPSISPDKSPLREQTMESFMDEMKVLKLPGKYFLVYQLDIHLNFTLKWFELIAIATFSHFNQPTSNELTQINLSSFSDIKHKYYVFMRQLPHLEGLNLQLVILLMFLISTGKIGILCAGQR